MSVIVACDEGLSVLQAFGVGGIGVLIGLLVYLVLQLFFFAPVEGEHK